MSCSQGLRWLARACLRCAPARLALHCTRRRLPAAQYLKQDPLVTPLHPAPRTPPRPRQMPNAVAQLGWVAGPSALLLFYLIQLTFSQLLASVFEVDGRQHPRYFESVAHILGRKAELACAWIQGGLRLARQAGMHLWWHEPGVAGGSPAAQLRVAQPIPARLLPLGAPAPLPQPLSRMDAECRCCRPHAQGSTSSWCASPTRSRPPSPCRRARPADWLARLCPALPGSCTSAAACTLAGSRG